jgi:hypothetical protein
MDVALKVHVERSAHDAHEVSQGGISAMSAMSAKEKEALSYT